MKKAAYIQRGETLDFLNNTGSNIEANAVVVFGKKIGIAGSDIENGTTGVLHVVGVFELDKKGGEEIKNGTPVFWNPDTGITATETEVSGEEEPGIANVPAGYAVADSSSTSKKILVKLPG